VNLYGFVGNNGVSVVDFRGLHSTTPGNEQGGYWVLRGLFPIFFVGSDDHDHIEKRFNYWEGGEEVWEELESGYGEESGSTAWLEVVEEGRYGGCCIRLATQKHCFREYLVRRAKKFRLYQVDITYIKSDIEVVNDVVGRATSVVPSVVAIPVDIAGEFAEKGSNGSISISNKTLVSVAFEGVGPPETRYKHLRSDEPKKSGVFYTGMSCSDAAYAGHMLEIQTSLNLSREFPEF